MPETAARNTDGEGYITGSVLPSSLRAGGGVDTYIEEIGPRWDAGEWKHTFVVYRPVQSMFPA